MPQKSKQNKKANKIEKAKWHDEREALKKIQWHFDMQSLQIQRLRVQAAMSDMNPSDYVRKMVGLTYRTLDRPRVSLSFSGSELEYLAQRYGLSVDDAANIRKQVKLEVESKLGT